MNRRCIDCGELTTRTRCTPCRRARANQYERQRARPSAHARGYGTEHQAARRTLARTLPAPCGYCGETIYPLHPWDAAHRVDGDPTQGWIIAHPLCNQQAKR